ncbi:MAG: TauD/TfdA family dioxygenase, partial [Proteobacteria bacterium]|nr:TauD/TfdA family dioxygenase [Pseudomonadota bacterium]
MDRQTSADTATRMGVHPLHPALGARITGVDLGKPMDAKAFRAVHDAWMAHLVLVFPGQRITDQEHVRFTRQFGEPEIFHQTHLKSTQVAEIFRVSNVGEDGQLLPQGDLSLAQLSLTRLWHTDSSYRPVPAMGSLLHGIEVSRSGGETCFTNMYAVYDALPASLRRQVEGRRAQHNFGHLHTLKKLKPLTEAERAAMPPVWQPMVRRHPVTGRKSLYISPIYHDAVEGLSPAAANDLITALAEFAGRPEFVYAH